ncbi:MAG TPA: hypothetical protein VJM11_03150 [Nevskiaceae bacterium]|nr:hypothetical protein [Nevskiaceae bacterium]
MFRLDMAASPAIQPPLDLPMPAGAQAAWEIIAGTIVAFTAFYFIRRARIERSAFPLLFWLGTVPLMFAEPLFDIGMTCFYPHVGQHTAFELYGRQMPVFLVLCYLGGIAPVMYTVSLRLAAGVDRAFVWKWFVFMALGTAVYEVITINLGLWTYYSPAHPIRLFNYPLGIGIENGAAFLLTALATAKLRPTMTGPRLWLAPLILPMVFVMGEFGTGWPYFSVINTASAIDHRWLGFAGLAGTLLFALVLTGWVASQVTGRRDRVTASAGAALPATP